MTLHRCRLGFIFSWLTFLLTACGGGNTSTHKPSAGSSQSEVSSASSFNSSISQISSSTSTSSSALSSSSVYTPIYINSDTNFRQVSVPDAVAGFENIDDWHVVGGKKSIVESISEGQFALKVENSQTLSLKSQPINTLRGIGDKISIDVLSDEDASPAFFIKLSIPSLGIYEESLLLQEAKELIAGVISRIEFKIQDSIRAQLNAEYNDLQFEVIVVSAEPLKVVVFDNLIFSQSTPEAVDKVEIELQQPDDFVYLMVNGIQRKVWSRYEYGNISTGRIDISSMFWKGLNAVRVQGINAGGTHSLVYNLWINDEQVIHKNCTHQTCGYLFDRGIFYDSVFVLNTPNLEGAAVVNLMSPEGANIYVDDLFVGKEVPAKLRLPPKNFRIGAGAFRDAPFNYQSQFYEREIHLMSGVQNLELTNADKLGVQQTARVAIVPVRNTKVSGFSSLGVLSDEGIENFRKNVEMANDEWILPLSYGLHQWDINVLPVVDSVILELPELLAGFSVGEFLSRAGLDSIKSQYEIIILHYSGYDKNNLRIDGGSGAGASAGNGYIIIPNVWPFESHQPSAVILHEALHVYEQAQRDLRYLYYGVNGLHGGEVHGYTPNSNLGEEAWLGWYRMFMRNAVKETVQMRDLQIRHVPSEEVDVQVGVFDTLRHGLGFLH